MSRRMLLLAVAIVVAVGAAWTVRLRDQVSSDMTTAAGEFLASLDEAQRAQASIEYDDPARLQWHFIPLPERKGVQIKDMSAEQRGKALALLKAGVSAIGYDKVTQIMSLEAILAELERERKNGPIRDPERYYFTVFGTPQMEGVWGWSVEGHHLSLNFAVSDGQLASHTPAFLGANPATVQQTVPGGPPVGTRVLKKEEELGFALYNALTPDQQEVALLDKTAPADLRGGGEPQAPQDTPLGILAANMTADQQDLLRQLIAAYTENMPPSVAATRLEEIRQAGFGNIQFAWAGANRPGIGHYYRVEGPTFQIELVNTQPDPAGNPANHVHSMWRDRRGDFGIAVPPEAAPGQ